MRKRKTYKLTKDMIPGQAFHPGGLLFDEIEYRKIKQKDLANEMHIAPTVLSELIHGKRNITADIALKLERALDIDATFWMRLQAKFEIDTIRIRERDKKQHTETRPLMVAEPKAKYNTGLQKKKVSK